MNRKERRAEEARLRKLRARDPESSAAAALLKRVQEAQGIAQRHHNALEMATKALQIASTLPEVAKPEDWEPSMGNPNFERDALLADGEALRIQAAKNFGAALLDVVELLNEFDEPAPSIISLSDVR